MDPRSSSVESLHGGTSDYIDGLRAALGEHEAAFEAVRAEAVVAGGSLATGSAAEVNMQSVEAAQ